MCRGQWEGKRGNQVPQHLTEPSAEPHGAWGTGCTQPMCRNTRSLTSTQSKTSPQASVFSPANGAMAFPLGPK